MSAAKMHSKRAAHLWEVQKAAVERRRGALETNTALCCVSALFTKRHRDCGSRLNINKLPFHAPIRRCYVASFCP